MPKQAQRIEQLDKARCAAFTPESARYRVTDKEVTRLKFVVEPTGRKYWTVRYVTNAGKNSEMALGDWPALLPKAAREKANEVYASTRGQHGQDPADTKRRSRQERESTKAAERIKRANTFESLSSGYLAASAKGLFGRGQHPKAISTLNKEKQHLRKHVFPEIGSKPIADIRRRDIIELRDCVAAKGTPSAANTCVESVRRVLAFALDRELLEFNPALGVSPLPTSPRQVTANEDQLRLLWAKLEDVRTAPVENKRNDAWASATILELALVTLQRRGEITAIHRTEVDWRQAIWASPAHKRKERRASKTPLSRSALYLLEQAFERSGGDWAFPARDGADKPMDPHSVTRFMARLRKATPELGEITPHDLRRTARTALTGERLGIDSDTAERVLNHVVGSAQARTYDVNSYLGAKRRALDAWTEELGRIVSGEEPPSNVISMQAATQMASTSAQ
ncbi:MAG TPA: tyrosine-type recombinase/integrase [Rhizomicrobium sp.]|nr:tyrosine-type recombinase/integrase [Rhizomicrobium sp.]